MWISVFFLAFLVNSPAAAADECPLDLNYVGTFPWDDSSCVAPTSNINPCCTTLLSLYGIAFAQRLRLTSLFRLPNATASAACLVDFQSNLSALSLPSDLVTTCFPSPQRFVISPDFCAGILTAQNWTAKVGSSSLDSACRPDLSVSTQCLACLNAGFSVTSQLTSLDGNASHATNCFHLVVTYAAGVANEYGPDDTRAAGCIFGLALSSPSSPSHSKSHAAAIFAPIVAALALVLLLSALGFYLWRSKFKKKTNISSSENQKRSSNSRSHPRPNTGSILYDIKELEKATNYFSQRNLIGRGGFGVVYKGTLADGSLVAVKKVLEPDLEGGDEEFRNEVEIISHLRHRNLVSLRGCCITDDDNMEEGKQRFLVYDYMPNGSLADHIFISSSMNGNGYSGRKKPPLSWPQRKNIILDVAKGLAYLHYGVKPAIYHRDIKATNILLDGEMKARVADFGLARQSREGRSHLTTRVAGTHGYLAPEYALYGQLTEKSDIYSFGVLVLEIMSGRNALDTSAESNMVLVTDWAWTLVKSGRAEEVLDAALVSDGEGRKNPEGIMGRFVLVGILCAHVMTALRPTISEALKMLEGDIDVPAMPDRPVPLGHGSHFGEGGAFTASPALSGFCLNTGDMLGD